MLSGAMLGRPTAARSTAQQTVVRCGHTVQVLEDDDEVSGGPSGAPSLPAWLLTLERVLTEDPPTSERVPLAVLTHEVEHWCVRGRAVSWDRRKNRTSLYADIRDTLSALGSALRSDAAPGVDRLGSAAKCLGQKHAPTEAEVSELRLAAKALRERLRRPSALEAAWRDVWKAAQKEDLELLEWRMSSLLDLLDLVGKDHRWAFTEALQALHATADGLSEEAWSLPLAAAGRALSVVPPESHCVVWLSYRNASLLTSFVNQLGPVALYVARWAVPNADKEDGQAFPHRDELRALLTGNFGGAWRQLHDPDADSREWIVLARVDLGVRTPHGALEAAEQVVQTMVEVAAYQWDGSPWVPIGPASLWTDGRLSMSSFGRREPGEYTVAAGRQQTAEGLSEHGEHVATALASRSLRRDLVDAVRLLHEAAQLDQATSMSRSTRRSSPSGRIAVVLEDSAVEHLASFAGISGDELDAYVLKDWAHSTLSRHVHRALDMCVYMPSTPREGTPQSELRQQLLRSRLGSPESLILAGARMEELIALCDEPTIARYARRWLETLVDPQAYLDRYEALVATGDRLARRTERVRNSVAHGNPADDGVVGSVRALSRYRAYVSLDIALASATQTVPMINELERLRGLVETRLSALKGGTSLVDHLSAAV